MTERGPAYDRLMEAYDARGVARLRARAEIDRQYAPIIARRHDEFRRACEADAKDAKP